MSISSGLKSCPSIFPDRFRSITGSNGKRKRERDTIATKLITNNNNNNNNNSMLHNIHPKDYVKFAFKASNGCNEDDIKLIINEASISRFRIPTREMIEEYGTDIVSAIRSNNVAEARRLYQEKIFQHNSCNVFGESILHIACRRGHIGMVRFLVEEVGLKVVEIRDDYHRTPLHDAFWTASPSYEVVDFLLQQPYVVELLLLPDKRGYTPLDYARAEDHSKWLQFLYERKSILRTSNMSKTNFVDDNNKICEQEIEQHDHEVQPQLVKRQRLCSSDSSSSISRIVSLEKIIPQEEEEEEEEEERSQEQ